MSAVYMLSRVGERMPPCVINNVRMCDLYMLCRLCVPLCSLRCTYIVPGMLVCSSFLISVCMFIVSKALLISSATVIVRAGGAIWLSPFSTVLFTVCSAVTVEWCVLYPCCVGVFGMFAVL